MTVLSFERFAAEVGQVLGVAPEGLTPDVDLYDRLGIDSLGLVAIGDRLEQALDIEFPAADVVACRLLEDFFEIACRLVAERAAAGVS